MPWNEVFSDLLDCSMAPDDPSLSLATQPVIGAIGFVEFDIVEYPVEVASLRWRWCEKFSITMVHVTGS